MASASDDSPADGERGARTRGTVLKSKVRLVGKMAVSAKKSKARGTIINANVTKGVKKGPDADSATATYDKKEIVDGTQVAASSINESGETIPTTDKVATHIKFPKRQSIMKQIAIETLEPPEYGTTPTKGALKSYNRTSIYVNHGLKDVALSGALELMRDDLPPEDTLDVRSYDDEEFTVDEQVEFLLNYGLSQCKRISFVLFLFSD